MNLIETKNLHDYQAAGGEPDSNENQRIRSQLVERNVLHRLNQTMDYLLHVASETQNDAVDYDELLSLTRRKADPEDVLSQNDLCVAENAEGEWYWWKKGDPQPFVGLPDGYTLRKVDEEEFEVLNDLEDVVGRGSTDTEALDKYWTREEGVDAFDSEEEAYQNALEENRIDETEYESGVYEYYAVDPWFSAKLAEFDETTGEVLDFDVWSRTTTGQSIAMDYIIAQIAASMQILVGQANDWSVK